MASADKVNQGREPENAGNRAAPAEKLHRSLGQRLIANSGNPKIAAPLVVLALAAIFSFWFLPFEYINPAATSWIFTRLSELTDPSGHAVQAMMFAREPWRWPPGLLDSFGGPLGASLINGAISPVFAFPAKLLETLGWIGPFWQFVGIQGLLGICLSSLSVYYLAQALGASRIAGMTAAILGLPLPNLIVVALFNESLSWQFLGVIPMILLLNDKNPSQPHWRWPALMGLAIWSNSYFAPMVLAFFAVHLWVIRFFYNTRLRVLGAQLAVLAITIVTLQYLAGGFVLPLRHLGASTDVMDLFSVDLADFFHSRYERQGYVYRGFAVLVLLSAWLCTLLFQRIFRPVAASSVNHGEASRRWRLSIGRLNVLVEMALPEQNKAGARARPAATLFILTFMTAAALFFLSLGPVIHFGALGSFRFPLSELLLRPMVMFRAIGRFSCPFVYLLLGIAALAIDGLVERIPATTEARRLILPALCSLLVAVQFVEMYPHLIYFRTRGAVQVAQTVAPNPALDAAVSRAKEIEFVPAGDDPAGAPWPFLAYRAIKYNVPVHSYHWLGRYDLDEMNKMRELSVANAFQCGWTTDRVYALKRSLLPRVAHCNHQLEKLAAYPDWVVLKLVQPGKQAPARTQLPKALSFTTSPGSAGAWTINLVYEDSYGASDLAMAQALINTSLSGPGACDLQVEPAAGRVSLLNDTATAWLGPVETGKAGKVRNSQCEIDGLGSRVVPAGNTLKVSVALTFRPGFAGAKTVFANGIDSAGVNSGWANLGAWTVPPQ